MCLPRVGESSGLDSTPIARRALNAGAVFGIRPVSEVELDALLPGLDGVALGDGGKGAEEETGGVSHDGGAARSDFVAGLKLIEFAERVVDGDGVAEFLNVPDENGSEVGLIEFFLAFGEMLGAKARISVRHGHAAAASAGGALLAMEQDRIRNNCDCFCLRVHGSSFR